MKYLYIEDLRNALKIWEYHNLVAEVIFQKTRNSRVSNFLPLVMEEYIPKPLTGSEVDEGGTLVRGIRHYKKLKSFIEDDYPYNTNNFLPRIPKLMKDLVPSQYSFVRSQHVSSILRLPLILDGWLETRKVFILEDLSLVSIIRPNNKSYLDYLPYSSFIIKVSKPFDIQINLNDGPMIFPVSTILVNSDDEFIDFMAIPYSVKGLLPEEAQIKKMEKLAQDPKKSAPNALMELAMKKSPVGFEFVGYSVNRKTLEIHNYQGGSLHKQLIMEDEKPLVVSDGEKTVMYTPEILSIINGVCKLISEIPVQKRETILKETECELNDKLDDFEWHKVAITQAKYLNSDGNFVSKETKHFTAGGLGSEKSYHIRRGHWKTIKKTGKRYWVEETEVRSDKKHEGPVKGSAVEILHEK